MTRFDLKISVIATSNCPVCYLKVPHPKNSLGNDIHAAGISKWFYGTHHDPNRAPFVQFYQVWFSVDSPNSLASVAHEALHGHYCKTGNHKYCGSDTSNELEMELQIEGEKLVEEFLGERKKGGTKVFPKPSSTWTQL